MRPWYKYSLDDSRAGTLTLPRDLDVGDYARTMDGYHADEAYASPSAFFEKYFFGYHLHRLEHYDRFLRRHLPKDHVVLSIGSGRCANELWLMQDGYRIVCSDVAPWPAYEATRTLFPQFEWMPLDILRGPSPQRYEAIICLSVIYQFDRRELAVFFRHVSHSLPVGGHLLLDAASPPDNIPTYFLHDILLKCEVAGLRIAKGLVTGRFDARVTKHHGYRRSDRDIVDAARPYGLQLRHREPLAFTTELRRSRVLNRLITSHAAAANVFSVVGRAIPSIRMFDFERVRDA